MKKFTFFIVVLCIVFLLAGGSLADDIPWECEWRPGVVVLRITPEYYVDTGDQSVERLGVVHIDQFMDDIQAISIERAYPYCLPPIKDGTDLAQIYNMYFPESFSVKEIAADLSKLAGVEWAEPWLIYREFPAPNDPHRDDQYGLDLCHANEAYEICTGNKETPVAIIDSGVDMNHPDLAANIWINPGEDLNGNGVIENDEINNEDDDRNGRIDDFYGWDFMSSDNDPDDTHGHGTHCAGIASAVTDNNLGVASVGHSCSIMAVRTGDGGYIYYGYQGIEYAARNGAKVISCSWGGYQSGNAEMNVISYAVEHDAMVLCAAGNENTSAISYPAGYENAIAVAATNSNDRRANFSNYGDWVDISAPGVAIASTYPGNRYVYMDGTSMACPFAASVAVLIRACYPDYTVAEATALLLDGADDINVNNIGAGRINAYESLALGDRPMLVIEEMEIDNDDNDNGRIEPGESAEIIFSIENSVRGTETEELWLTLSTDDNSIAIENEIIEFPNLGPGEDFSNEDEPFVITMNEDAIAHTTFFTLTVTAEPRQVEIITEYEVIIGYPNILLVDDDSGQEVDEYYKTSIEEMGLGWVNWDVSKKSSPGFDYLNEYPMIIWFTGDSEEPLDELDLIQLTYALEDGANVMLVGKKIGDSELNQELLENWFGARHETDSVRARFAFGLPGTPLESAESMILFGNDVNSDALNSPTSMIPINDADSLLIYRSLEDREPNGCAAVYRIHPETDAHLMYFGFSFESIAERDGYTPRHEVMRLIYNWFMNIEDNAVNFDDFNATPLTLALDAAYPNPFNGFVSLDFTLPYSVEYKLTISDFNGREISIIASGSGSVGNHQAVWNAEGTPSGTYFARLSAAGHAPVERRLVLVK
ncbi:S8 family serine peptidase [bacterium]|nr:S8 family serine peptidase [bacterium]